MRFHLRTTIIHIKFDSVIRRDHDLLSVGLNLIRSKRKRKLSKRRANDSKCLFIAERHNSRSSWDSSGKGQTVINKLRFQMKYNRIKIGKQ